MRYFGGKSKVGRAISTRIADFVGEWVALGNHPRVYIEPFVGACGVMQYMPDALRPFNMDLWGVDIDPEMIALWQAGQRRWNPPTDVTLDLYTDVQRNPDKYTPHLRAFVKVGCSFAGKPWGGYARSAGGRNYAANAASSYRQKASRMDEVHFRQDDYRGWLEGATDHHVLYLDPPYSETSTPWGTFDNQEFWAFAEGAALRGALVFVSEYTAPPKWSCVWEGDISAGVRQGRNQQASRSTERLFLYTGA